MHSLCDGLPAFDLRVGVNAGCGHVAFAYRRDLRAFADDEARATALAVVVHIHGATGNVAMGFIGATACEWGHDDAVGHLDVTDECGLEKLGCRHGLVYGRRGAV